MQTGLGALSRTHVGLIAKSQRERVGDSIDLDRSMRATHPSENRWDYVVSVPDANSLVGVEPHSARDDEIDGVLRKKRNAELFLRDHLVDGVQVSDWLWVSSGRIRFSAMERSTRILSQHGIRFVGHFVHRLI